MKVSEMRGVILYLAEKNGLSVCEYSPPQIKLAVSGNGHSDKKSIIKMVPLLIKIEKIIVLILLLMVKIITTRPTLTAK